MGSVACSRVFESGWQKRLLTVNSRLPFFALALAGLLSGIWAGWIRIGFDLPGVDLATLHGPLMVGGFTGTLIGIERSVLSGNGKWWLIPVLSGAAVVAWLLGVTAVAPYLLAASAALLVAMQAIHLWQKRELATGIVQLAGALCFLAGNVRLLLNPFMPAIVPFWMGFILCFILATRTSDVSLKSRGARLAVRGGLLLYMAGLVVPFHLQGNLFTGGGLMLIAFGMLITEFEEGDSWPLPLNRYAMGCIMAGWAWLLVAGIGLAFWKEHLYGYDGTVHAFFVGFLFSMVFIHALGKAAALAELKQPPYHPIMMVWPILLSISLVMRVFAGDILLMEQAKKWAGLVNGLSIFGFLITLVLVTLRKRSQSKYEAI